MQESRCVSKSCFFAFAVTFVNIASGSVIPRNEEIGESSSVLWKEGVVGEQRSLLNIDIFVFSTILIAR